jgi:hypothetical protein
MFKLLLKQLSEEQLNTLLINSAYSYKSLISRHLKYIEHLDCVEAEKFRINHKKTDFIYNPTISHKLKKPSQSKDCSRIVETLTYCYSLSEISGNIDENGQPIQKPKKSGRTRLSKKRDLESEMSFFPFDEKDKRSLRVQKAQYLL